MIDPRKLKSILFTMIRIIVVSLALPAIISIVVYFAGRLVGFSEISSFTVAAYIQIIGTIILLLFGVIHLTIIIRRNLKK